MRFADLLKTTVLLSAGAATTLGLITVAAATQDAQAPVVVVLAAWWVIAGVLGAVIGRHDRVTPAIGRLLASAKSATSLPEIRPGAMVVNRLWPLLGCTVAAGALAFVAPQIPGIATGFAIIWALAWRGQDLKLVVPTVSPVAETLRLAGVMHALQVTELVDDALPEVAASDPDAATAP